jgi:polyhydroxyalkanoate synthesis repressor PhaR
MSSKHEIYLYSNRRLYDPAHHRYITYLDVQNLIGSGVEFCVRERTTGTDCTDHILLKMLVQGSAAEIPGKGGYTITAEFLRQLIRTSCDFPAPLISAFLDHCLRTLQSPADRLPSEQK